MVPLAKLTFVVMNPLLYHVVERRILGKIESSSPRSLRMKDGTDPRQSHRE